MTTPAPIGVIGHYNLLERLEPSGPGDLYRARDTRLGRTVVVRVLPPDFGGDAAARETLIETARSTTVLSHPNATALFDIGEHDGRVYLVFEFLNGRSLRAEMGGRPVKVRRAVEIAIQIADAVAEAHAAGFAHGGLSPESVTITARGHAKIPAFDLAVRSGFTTDTAGAGNRSRLLDYESPEEAKGQPPDDRSDVYSVGAILYEMLTARRPPHRGAAAPSASNPHVPPELDQIALKASAPNPDSRYQAVAALASELRSFNAMLDERGSSDDEDVADAHPNSLGRVLAVTIAIVIVVAAIAWWLMRR